jgi:LacI family transcriptional regulator
MSATIQDVAALAKVSISTVSRVLNRPHLVSIDTRQRVERAIKLLTYSRNIHAQRLMSSRSDLPQASTSKSG